MKYYIYFLNITTFFLLLKSLKKKTNTFVIFIAFIRYICRKMCSMYKYV